MPFTEEERRLYAKGPKPSNASVDIRLTGEELKLELQLQARLVLNKIARLLYGADTYSDILGRAQ